MIAADHSNAVLVLLGNGDGTFQTPVSYPVGAEPWKPELADLNGDGQTDVVVVNTGGNSISVLRGNGDGTFQPAITLPVRPDSFSPVVSDLNADGKPDLAIVNAGSSLVDVLLNSPSLRSVAINATAAAPASGVLVATLIDYDTSMTAGNFTATISWGDGTSSTSGTVSDDATGGFKINGTHTYAREGIYSVNVQLTDGLGNFATVTSIATVADAPLTATGKTFSAIRGKAFTGVVANFTDADPTGQPSEFSATINWGDGTAPTSGTVSVDSSGGFTVTGTHTYGNTGSFSIRVKIKDVGGSTTTADSTAETLTVTNYETLSLTDAHIESIRTTPGNCLVLFEQYKADLAEKIGFPMSDAELYAVFCSIVAYRMAPYGISNEVELPSILAEPFLNCGNYTLLTGYLNELRNDHVPLRYVGFDNGAVGNHSQIFANERLLLDPTIALIALGSYQEVVSGVQVGPIVLFTTRLDELSGFRQIVINALTLAQYKASDVIYDYDTLTEFLLGLHFDPAKSNQTIAFGALAPKTFGDPDFSISATATSGLPVSFGATGKCTVVTGNTVSITGGGLCRIIAVQYGNSDYNPARYVSQTFSIAKANQTITFGALAPMTFGDPDFNVGATASSDLPVSFAATGNCTVTGTAVHITGAGSCTITAEQGGDSNYNLASSVPQTFSIARANQTIAFGALAPETFGDLDFSVGATASSDLPVSFFATGNCTVTGIAVHITGGGSCTITAAQGGDSNYYPAASVPQTFSITRANQTITFGALANKTFGDPDVILSATASSNLPVSFAASGQCTVTGNAVHLTAPGSCTITAAQDGDSSYNPAASVPQTFIVKANQTITFGALAPKTFGDPDFNVSATASSDLPVSFAATGNCTVTGTTVHLTVPGSCTITAAQGGDSNYNPAVSVPQTFSIARANQTVTFAPLAPKTFGDPDFSVSATASSDLPVSFAATGNCTVTSTAVHITGAGSCTITAAQGGDSNYNPAASVPQTFSIAKSNQTITFGALANKAFGDPDFIVSATASSNLAVSFAASGQCTVTGNTVHLTTPGSCTITASQGGDSKFNAANDVPQSFNIAKAATTTGVSSSINPSGLTQSVTFTATVTSKAGTPTGTAQFKDNDTKIGAPVSLNANGVAQMTPSSLIVGTHTITADYGGDGNCLPSTGTLEGDQVVKAQPSLSINDVSLTEGDTGTKTMNFTVTLSDASNLTVTVDFATANGTATAGSDYQSANATLTFNPGQTTQTIGVTINGDQISEPDETFFVNLSNAVNAAISKATGIGTILNDDAQGGIISFSQSNYTVSESEDAIIITVNRAGDTNSAVTVDYATPDDSAATTPCSTVNGIALSRCDFTAALGTLRFAAGETSKTFTVLITQDSFVEGPESLTLTLSNLTGSASFGVPSTATLTIMDDPTEPVTNPIDGTEDFIRQHYHEFLSRQADNAGLTFWTNELASCGSDQSCIEGKRVSISAAFYLSVEFQQTGYLVERIYKAAYGDAIGTSTLGGSHQVSVPIIRFNELVRESEAIGKGVVVGQSGWEQVLENNKQAYTAQFVSLSRFTSAFPTSMSASTFVDTLNTNAGGPLSQSERDQLVNGLTSGTMTRAQVLRAIAEDPNVASAEFNRAFVLMQYFGYLRRDPNEGLDSDYTGYDFWLTKLNQFNGNFVNAEMVKAFITSSEYRQRFGP